MNQLLACHFHLAAIHLMDGVSKMDEEEFEKKRSLIEMRKNLLALREEINEHKREFMESITSIGQDELNNIFRLICAEERDELGRLRRLLKESFEREAGLNKA